MDLTLDGKVALVTGASRGIGEAIAKAYADAGAKVMLSSRKQQALEETAARIGGTLQCLQPMPASQIRPKRAFEPPSTASVGSTSS